MQGEITIEITPQFAATRSWAGAMSTTPWNLYDFWCEGEGFALLVLKNGAFQVLNLCDLAQAEHEQLRTILADALPER